MITICPRTKTNTPEMIVNAIVIVAIPVVALNARHTGEARSAESSAQRGCAGACYTPPDTLSALFLLAP